MDRGAGPLFTPVRDSEDLYRVNLGRSLLTVASVQAPFDAEGIRTQTYRTGDGEGHNPTASTILLFPASDIDRAAPLLADVLEVLPPA